MDPALRELLRSGIDADPERTIEAIIRLDRPGIEIPGVELVARFGAIATCRLRACDVVEVHAHDHVVSLKAARPLSPGSAGPGGTEGAGPGAWQPGLRDSDRRRPPDLSVSGATVAVAAVDWGVDIDAAVFRRPLDPAGGATQPPGGATRFLAIWDQRDRALGPRPVPYGYGAVHDRNEIDQALRWTRPYEQLGYHPAIADAGRGSHGTHVLDIAAGNGRTSGPVGLAPEADLIFVHLADRDTSGLANLGDSVRLLEAVDFIVRTAGDRPWVINLSVGRCGGPHDGTTLVELAFDELLAGTSGGCIVQSAGNYHRSRTHASGWLAAGETRTFTFVVDPADATPNELEIWYPGTDELVVRVDPPGHKGRAVALGQATELVVGGRIAGRVYHRASEPNSGANHIDAFLYPVGFAGTWTVTLEARRVLSGRYDAWLERDDVCPRCQVRFAPDDADPESSTGTLANSHLPLVVGAYNGHNPDRPLAPFSSGGPTRDGRDKPDLCAPGVDIIATRSAGAGTDRAAGLLVAKSGTSMATPQVTGAIALCLQLAGHRLSATELRELVLASCDPPDPTVEAHRAGHGYLNLPQLLSMTSHALTSGATAPNPKESAMDIDDLTRFVTQQPSTAYREYQYRPDGDIAHRIDQHFHVVARPGQAPNLIPQEGDLVLQVTLGQMGIGQCATLDEPALNALRRRGRCLQGELVLRSRDLVGPRVFWDQADPTAAADATSVLAYDEEDDPKVEPHVRAARELWTKLFGNDNVLNKVTIFDLSKVPSKAVKAEGYGAWTNSTTRIYIAPVANRNSITLETTLRHEAVHVQQFARDGQPDSYEKMIGYEQKAYEEQWKRLDGLAKDLTARRGRSKAQNDQLEQLLAVTKVQLDALEGEIAKVTKTANQQAESSYRAFLLKGFLPSHSRLRDLYEPPKQLRNPSAQESEPLAAHMADSADGLSQEEHGAEGGEGGEPGDVATNEIDLIGILFPEGLTDSAEDLDDQWSAEGEQIRTPVRSKLPFLVLGGPIVRRAEPDSVWFWFASSEEITSCTPSITVLDSAGIVQADLTRRMELVPVNPRVAKLGDQLWVVLIEARPKDLTFSPGWTYGYDLLISPAGGPARRLRDLVKGISYRPFDRPTFTIASSGTDRIAHGSCRRPGGNGSDAFPPFDQWLASEIAAGVRGNRPPALMLTGDQIYADDIAYPLFQGVQRLARDLFGYVEELPARDGKGAFSVSNLTARDWRAVTTGVPTDRAALTRRMPGKPDRPGPIGFSTEDGEGHLLSFAEFAAMYLLVWSPDLWQLYVSETPHLTDSGTNNLRGFGQAIAASRRVLANTPTYMLLDDHEITDDWNLDSDWAQATQNPTAQRVISNGLAAYWAFQAWGNDPNLFDKSFGDTITRHLHEISNANGHPGAAAAAFDQALHVRHWSYIAPTQPQALCVDTRTRRQYVPGKPGQVLSGPRVWNELAPLLAKHPFKRSEPLLIVLPTPLLPHRSMLKGQSHRYDWPKDRYEGDFESYGNNPSQRPDLIAFLRSVSDPPAVIVFSGDVHHGSVIDGLYVGGPDLNDIYRGKGTWGVKVAQITSSSIKNVNRNFTDTLWWTGFLTDAGNVAETVVAQYENQYKTMPDGTKIALRAQVARLSGSLGRETYIFENHLCVVDLTSSEVRVLFVGAKDGRLATATTQVSLRNNPSTFRPSDRFLLQQRGILVP